MYVLLDENKRYTGSYSLLGTIAGTSTGGVLVPELPPCEDLDKQKFYRWDTHNIQTGINYIPVMIEVQDKDPETEELLWEDEEKTIPLMTQVQDTDEEGIPKFTEEPIMEDVTEWIFDESDELVYNNYIKEQAAIIPPITQEELIANLQKENAELKAQMVATNTTVESLMTEILPSLMG